MGNLKSDVRMSLSDIDRQRATEYGIDVLAADQLRLSTYLRNWAKA